MTEKLPCKQCTLEILWYGFKMSEYCDCEKEVSK